MESRVTTTVSSRAPGRVRSRRLVRAGRRGLVAAALVGVAAGVVLAMLMPRGPVTEGQGLAAIGLGLVAGAVAGAVARSRLAYALAPVALLLAFEAGRLGASGPTVDAPHFDGAYAILAFVLGRVGVVALAALPAGLGVAYGRRLARTSRSPSRAGAAVVTVASLALVAVAAWVARPGETPPILGPDGAPLPGSIATLDHVALPGGEQGIMLRGHDVANPVLLYLSGGPGQSDLPYARVLLGAPERDFVVVGWDQRGTGTSYAALDPVATHTLDGAIEDTIALAEHLRERFDEDAVYLLGESWGSLLGVLAAQRRPDLVHAVVGSGQMVNPSLTDRLVWRDLLAYAEETDQPALYDRVLTYGEPPYRDVPWANAFAMAHYGALTPPYDPPAAYLRLGTAAGLGPWGLLGSEYGAIDKLNVLRGLMDSFAVLYPQLQEIDLRRDVPRLEVPVVLLDGEAELAARRDLAVTWFDALDAPFKDRATFATAGHSVAFEQFEALRRLLVDTVVPATYVR